MSSLPRTWKMVQLRELGRWTGGGTPSKSHSAYWVDIGIPWVSPKDMKRAFIEDAADHISESALANSSTNLVPEGSILVVTRSGILSHTLPVAKVLRDVAINQDLKALIPRNDVDSDYVLHILKSNQATILNDCGKAGTTVANLDTDKFLNFRVPLPPFPEQRQIVARLQALLGHSDKAREELTRVPRLNERYREAIFAAATRGELTSDWRSSNSGVERASTLLRRIHASINNQPSASTLVREDRTLPETWVRCKVSDVGEVTLGRQRSPRHHSGSHMRPYLRVANVFENRIDTNDVMEMNFTPTEYERFKLKAQDILLNEGQSKELIGRPAMFMGELEGVCFTNTLVRFRAYPPISAAYALLVFRHYFRSGLFQSIANITTNIAHLGAGRFADLSFPLPPLAEQAEIVNRCSVKVDAVEMVGAHVSKALDQLERLEQATLDKAFRGELTSANSGRAHVVV